MDGTKGQGPPQLPGAKKVADVEARDKQIEAELEFEVSEEKRKALEAMPLWDREAAALEAAGTTPRDIFETDILGVIYPSGPRGEEIKKNCRFLWISHVIEHKRPMLTGFMQDMYKPVTQAVMDELGIRTVTRDRTPEGVPRSGHDAVLYWCPEKMAVQQNEVLLAGAEPMRRLKALQDETEGRFTHQGGGDRGAIGGISFTDSDTELAEVAEQQRSELGTAFKGGPRPLSQYN